MTGPSRGLGDQASSQRSPSHWLGAPYGKPEPSTTSLRISEQSSVCVCGGVGQGAGEPLVNHDSCSQSVTIPPGLQGTVTLQCPRPSLTPAGQKEKSYIQQKNKHITCFKTLTLDLK